jgi:hypothetical protein
MVQVAVALQVNTDAAAVVAGTQTTACTTGLRPHADILRALFT